MPSSCTYSSCWVHQPALPAALPPRLDSHPPAPPQACSQRQQQTRSCSRSGCWLLRRCCRLPALAQRHVQAIRGVDGGARCHVNRLVGHQGKVVPAATRAAGGGGGCWLAANEGRGGGGAAGRLAASKGMLLCLQLRPHNEGIPGRQHGSESGSARAKEGCQAAIAAARGRAAGAEPWWAAAHRLSSTASATTASMSAN
jgi:hypothetical protein